MDILEPHNPDFKDNLGKAKAFAKYAELEARLAEYNEKVEKLMTELSDLNKQAVTYNDAVKAAEEDLKNAKTNVEKALEAYSGFRRTSAIALSYIEDKETELAEAEEKVAAKEKEIEERKDDSKLEKLNSELDELKANDEVIVITGTTAETYLTEKYPNIKLQKYDTYANAKTALENGQAAAWANDNTEVIAYALQNKGYTVGIPELGSKDTIAPAVSKGNKTLLDWINSEIEALGKENFFHADYEATLTGTYGSDYEEKLVVEGGKVN